MAYSPDYLNFLLDQFSAWGDVSHKKMFGGVGFYREGVMFGGIMGPALHLKVDDQTRPEFIERGMEPFQHGPKKKAVASYYQVPPEVVEDADELAVWSEKALAAALRSKKK